MATLIAFPVLGLATLLQTAIVSRIPLLNGAADLILLILVSWALQERVRTGWQWALVAGLFLGWLSALPTWLAPLSYLLVVGVVLLLRTQVWQIPLLALFTATFLGTIITHVVTFTVLRLEGTPLDFRAAFNLVTLPSLLLNMLLALPINGAISELARWAYPAEIEA